MKKAVEKDFAENGAAQLEWVYKTPNIMKER